MLLAQQLDYLGHNVTAAQDAEIAIKLWDEANQLFDLTITDCTMPGMDGFELAQILRLSEQEHRLPPHPILGLTALAESDVVGRCKAAGMTDCMFKPVRLESLMEMIERVVQNEAIHPHSSPVPLRKVAQKAQHKPELMRELYDEVIKTNRQDIKALELACSQNNHPQIAQLTHRLIGGARMINAIALEKACLALQQLAVDHAHSAELAPCLQQVKKMVQALEIEISHHLD
jgi:two-component system sensor histidine kinase EvgS